MESEAIRNMVDNILAGNNAEAQNNFNTAMAEKLTSSLDDKKQEIAASLGKKEEEDEAVQ
jgi:hypothetical protein